MKRLATVGLVSATVWASACSGGAPANDDAGVGTDAASAPDGGSVPTQLGPAERPATLVVPPAHDGVTPLPIVFLLHGYSASAEAQDLYFRASITARANGYYLVLPNGTEDASGNRFWNATLACCDFGGTDVDDVGYLTSLLDEAESLLPIDTSRVYFYGHSNGGFMSYRMACELSDRITAIASLAGADFLDEMDCVPTQPVAVLQVHGTLDETISYDGGATGPIGGYPSAHDSVVRWAERAGCDTTAPIAGEPLDLVTSIAGAETTVEEYRTGCAPAADAALWSIVGGSHIPALQRSWGDAVWGWLSSHQR